MRGWEITRLSKRSLWKAGCAPEKDTEKRAMQVMTAADKGESVCGSRTPSFFVQAL